MAFCKALFWKNPSIFAIIDCNQNKKMKYLLKIAFPVLAVALYVSAFASVSFAEGNSICSGKITGVVPMVNQNAGVTSFNSHQGSRAQDNSEVDLSVVGLANGLAPGNGDYAACVNKEA